MEYTNPNALVPYGNNAKVHSPKQVDKIADSISEFGFNNPILVDQDYGVIAGHARLKAALQLGLTKVPVIILSHLNEEQKAAYILADNRLAEINVEWDMELVQRELMAMSEDMAALTGFKIDDSLPEDENYTRKIETPVYEITGDKPEPEDLYNTAKTDLITQKIDESDAPETVKLFLQHAAQRHTVFDFALIAEYYAHAEPEVQQLMEDSALVIIDFEEAIDKGFVKLTKKFAEQFALEKKKGG